MQQAVSNWWNAAFGNFQSNSWRRVQQTAILLFYTAFYTIVHFMQWKMKDKLFFPFGSSANPGTRTQDSVHWSSTSPAQLLTSPTTLKVTITHDFTALRTTSWQRQSSETCPSSFTHRPSAQPQPLKTSFDFITAANRDDGINHTEEGRSEELPCKARKRSEVAAAARQPPQVEITQLHAAEELRVRVHGISSLCSVSHVI